MSETVKIGFLIMGTKVNSEGDVFHGHHLNQIPIWTDLRITIPCIIPMHIGAQFGNNSGTNRL
jgi:hypothetical protein